jgi:hypothetical protein
MMDDDGTFLLKQRDAMVDDNFGPNEQPSLDVVEIKVKNYANSLKKSFFVQEFILSIFLVVNSFTNVQ